MLLALSLVDYSPRSMDKSKKIVSVDTLLSAESFDKYDLIMSELSWYKDQSLPSQQNKKAYRLFLSAMN